jgi:hypothetical protein
VTGVQTCALPISAEKLFSFSLSEDGLHALAQISENYLLCQLEKTLPTLEFYRTIKGG